MHRLPGSHSTGHPHCQARSQLDSSPSVLYSDQGVANNMPSGILTAEDEREFKKSGYPTCELVFDCNKSASPTTLSTCSIEMAWPVRVSAKSQVFPLQNKKIQIAPSSRGPMGPCYICSIETRSDEQSESSFDSQLVPFRQKA